jgi:hypothetical protein
MTWPKKLPKPRKKNLGKRHSLVDFYDVTLFLTNRIILLIQTEIFKLFVNSFLVANIESLFRRRVILRTAFGVAVR